MCAIDSGQAVVAATAGGFASSGLELGGKDPAYVRADANVAHAVDSLTDGAFFNAGQACCGIKRIYVDASRYDDFVAGVVELTEKYRLGSPLDPETTIGPVVRAAAAEAVRAQVRDAVARGAVQLIKESSSPAAAETIVHAMEAVATEAKGTGRRAPVAGISLAMKTGTAGERKSGLEALINDRSKLIKIMQRSTQTDASTVPAATGFRK